MTVEIAFDKIATAYDAQRAHPPDVALQVGQTLADMAGRDGRILELGVGTGRIALPLVAAGAQVVGIDIAHDMLRVAQGRDGRLPLLRGDIAALPFGSERFSAVLAVHVLHLVPDWRGALAEAWRVLRPGGVLLQGRDWRDPQSCAERLRGKMREAVMELVPGSRPPGAGAAVAQALAKLGGVAESERVGAEWATSTTPQQVLAGMAQRADAETWALSDELLAQVVARVRAWAADTWNDLDAPQEIKQRFLINPIRKPT